MSFLNTKLEENIKIKLISESMVLLIVNPSSIFDVIYERISEKNGIHERKTITVRGTSPMI